ncbi:uncharacterized protein LOC121738336 isoform X2 [Aricia agestis]|uniref:uncharacterized protein LOC121738336 isoform X2 n=1 Tax=Aricia agestis TaxID=91739 RepID=UPI001C206557|nr:uncharacterized protein LOC121738336 isoform X2 [Aricia agestis]
MPYIMVMGSLSLPNLTKDEGATVYGLKRDERATLVRDLNSSFGVPIASASDIDRTVRVTQKGITLVVVNRIHGLLGYDVVSHAMAMTNANRELISFTMYKKSSGTSQGHGSHGQGHGAHGQGHGTHGQGHGTHGQGHGTHGQGQSSHKHGHGGIVTL